MTKENILFVIIGLLGGLIIGFMFANSVNQSAAYMPAGAAATAAATTAGGGAMKQNSNMPAGHPDIGGNTDGGGAAAGGNSMSSVPEVQAAIDEAKKAPDNYDAQVKAAEMYYQIGRYDGAIEFLKKANQMKPDNYEVVVNLGNANFDAGRFEEAEKWYSTALGKKADDVNVRTDLGLTYIFREPPNFDRAVQEFKRSLEIDPNHTQTLQNLTVAYTKKGDVENAKQTLARLESLDAANPTIAKLRGEIQKMEIK